MVEFTVTVTGATPAESALIQQHVLQAAAAWGRHLVGDATLDIAVTARDLPGGTIAQAGSAILVDEDRDGVFQEGAVSELVTGRDPNGDAPDIFIDVDVAKLAQADAIEVFTHELGHALAFNGWGSGELYVSTYDRLVSGTALTPVFRGTAAMAMEGGPVPLAPESPKHYLEPGLMNAYHHPTQHNQIGALDLAILSDTGAPVKERFGTLADDFMALGRGDDAAYGGYGHDTLDGNQGTDTLYGWIGDDKLRGGKGDDLLLGGDGNDTLSGDLGNDTLTGGRGADRFCFGDNDGYNIITDFEISLGDPSRSDSLQFASEATASVDYPAYSVTWRAGSTVVVLQGCISIMPDLVSVA